MKLLYSPASPYSAKVRMAARYLEIEAEAVQVATGDEPALLVDANPLGKIPTLLLKDGTALYDSRMIMQYLNRISGKTLYPRKDDKRTEAELLEALCDGITDAAITIVYERRMRPEEKVHQPIIDRQWRKVTRGLDYLEAHLPKTGKSLHGGHFSLAALLAYLMLRFPGQWEEGRPALAAWPAKFEKRFPDYPAIKPQA
ncbi:glutathione S-transferase [Rhizobium halophytocola]|uniref:Glutathione S-transferase n=1 Tax=Rhizobium halophytocola TaxID=735519 RepID=A0ABS4DYF5_9HYPH|nr:glutathione S-transferase [Rhizobium halophytocola]MBP1850723.1 glutathione S-transferase [Rhizobium halophytocola]